MQNIDTDQIIPAEYLTLVPSKVQAECCGWAGIGHAHRVPAAVF